ncbi:SDR family NAD(P)-dependent oxidoreductase [Vibrio rhizosphaerae]|uniref:SDR family NAD(P)-dependent oxidoreductase n=1 Tax=Vibrio rhizosphaerae TaxID=398736 RepID=UPI0005703F9A|nr:SDR family NAD(P)-dependent oxidoreductase [Vibrio rhizosphaerae]
MTHRNLQETTPMQDTKELFSKSLNEIKRLKAINHQLETMHKEPIAIVGAACRYPGGIGSLEQFWEALEQGRDCIERMQDQRWPMSRFLTDNPHTEGGIYSDAMGLLENVDRFDPAHFGLSVEEAIHLDPQHRLLMEMVWETIEDAGYAVDSFSGTRTGVYIGLMSDDYGQLQGPLEKASYYVGSGTARSCAAGRLSYTYGLEGPAMTIDTACSSSLVSVHLAVQAIRRGECDKAIAGGANLILSPQGSVVACRSQMLSRSGHCQTFDINADGYVRSEGCGTVLLKRLSSALQDGDQIYALIRGSAINHDGRSQGLTAPSGQAQRKVIAAALDDAGVSPDKIEFVECHGTGTALGDPIEVRALESAYIKQSHHQRKADQPVDRLPLKLGALKSNLGHMESAAGIGGLHKAMEVIRHRKVPQNLHFKTLNPQIKVDQSMLHIVDEPTPLATEGPVFAGVSSFGFSGTNAHIILESYTEAKEPKDENEGKIFRLSARSRAALNDYAKQYLEFLNQHSDIDLSALCYTAATGRDDSAYRIAFAVNDVKDLEACLKEYIEVTGGDEFLPEAGSFPLLWVISGQTNVDWRLAHHLYQTRSTYRSSIEKAYKYLEEMGYPHSLADFESILTGTEQTADVLPHAIHRWALAELLVHLGLSPTCITGIGVGEYVAASVAGLIGWQSLMDILSTGTVKKTIALGRKRYDFVSSAGKNAVLPESWFGHEPLAQNVTLETLGATFSIEYDTVDYCCISLDDTLSLTMTDTPEENLFQWVYGQTNRDATMPLQGFLAQCYMSGYTLHWERVYEDSQCLKMSLPTYPFQRQSIWTKWGYSFDETLPSTVGRSGKMLQMSSRHERQGEEVIEHPILQTVFACPSGIRNFQGELSLARMPYLGAHQILGESIVPVSLFVDIVLTAGRWCWPEQNLWIEDLQLLHKCPLGEAPIDIYCHVNPDAGTVSVYSKLQHAKEWQQHVRGRLSTSAQATAMTPQVSLSEFQHQCHEAIAIRHFYQGIALSGMTYGEDFQGIFEIYRGPHTALAKIALPPTVEQSLVGYSTHPILLDGCLQAIVAASVQRHEQGVRVPSQVRGIRLFKPLPEILWCAVEVSSVNSSDTEEPEAGNSYASLTVFDSLGEVVMTIERFETTHYTDTESVKTAAYHEWLYDKQWLPDETDGSIQARAENPASVERHWLLFSDQGSVCKALETALIDRGDRVSVLCLNQPEEPHYRQVSFQSMADLNEVFDAVEHDVHALTGVIYGWSVTPFEAESLGHEQLSIYAKYPLWVCQSILDPRRRRLALSFLTCDSQPVYGQAPSQPLAAMLWGHVTSYINENVVHANLIDLLSTDLINNHDLDHVLHILDQVNECQFAIRNGQRLIARILPSQTDLSHNVQLDTTGTYLITGGLGALGLETAKALIRQGARHLILVGRRAGLTDDSQAAIQSLEALGASVYPLVADISKAHAFVNSLTERLIGLPPLKGVVHSAGVLADGVVAQQSWEDYLKVFAPKVAGTLSLYQAVREQALDFFVIYSSAASILGNPGQANYAAANSFVDSFVWYLRGQGVAATSINWGGWSEIGLAANMAQQVPDRENALLGLIPPRQGIQVIEEQLISAHPQFAVLPLNRQMTLDGDKMPYLRQLLSNVLDDDRKHLSTSAMQKPEEQSTALSVLASLGRVHGNDRCRLLKQYLNQVIGEMLKIPGQLDERASLFDLGLDSLLGVDLRLRIEKDLDCVLASTLFHDYSTIESLTTYLLNDVIKDIEVEATQKEHSPTANPMHHLLSSADVKVTISQPEKPQETPQDQVAGSGKNESHRKYTSNAKQGDIAIIGLSGRYPGASDLETFWENLREGYDGITRVPEERWDAAAYYDERKNVSGKSYGDIGGFIEGVDQFDPEFFNIPQHMAAYIDPKERLFLETVWNLLEDAAYTRDKLKQNYHSRVGVFVGAMYQLYSACAGNVHEQTATMLSSYNAIAHRVSYFFNLKGPSVAIDTMCSSSLTSVHLACQSLYNGDCEIAIAGGVNLSLHPLKYVGLSQAHIMGSHAGSRSFSDGDGYLPSEGVGAVLLKPLERAIEDGDRIEAVIKASTINHGGHSTGFYAPNPEAQTELIETNFQRAQLTPDSIQYVEAAANGASLGDSIEFKVLNQVFMNAGVKKGSCPMGTVKSNIGHAEAASGMAQIAKVILQMKHQTMIPTVKAEPLNPNIPLLESPFRLLHQCQRWEQPENDQRRATVSSFGAGGANAHLILEEYAPTERSTALKSSIVPHGDEMIVLSARSKTQLQQMVKNMLMYLDKHQSNEVETQSKWLADIAHTLQTGREEMDCRLSLLVSSIDELRQGLSHYLSSESVLDTVSGKDIAPVLIQTGNIQDQLELRNLLLGVAGEAMAQSLIAERQLEKLMLHWVQGGRICWDKLRQGQPVKCISLPTYPFERQRYWLSGPTTGEQRRREPQMGEEIGTTYE